MRVLVPGNLDMCARWAPLNAILDLAFHFSVLHNARRENLFGALGLRRRSTSVAGISARVVAEQLSGC